MNEIAKLLISFIFLMARALADAESLSRDTIDEPKNASKTKEPQTLGDNAKVFGDGGTKIRQLES